MSRLGNAAAARAERLERQIEDIHRRWRVAWEKKSVAELRTRINLWRAYLRELAESPDEVHAYPREVRNRALAAYLLESAGNQSEARTLASALRSLDERLRSVFVPGDFVWEPELRPVFPAESYWYLYGRPEA